MMTDKEIKAFTMSSLNASLDNIYACYSRIYDLYHSDGDVDQDVCFIHDLVDAIKGIEAVLEVYTRDNYIHPGYALEKLNYGKSIFEITMKYYEDKLKEGENND